MTVRASPVAGTLPVREDGRVLLVLRPTGTWDPPAGRLAPGESFEAGAVREVHEETGLLVPPEAVLATWVGERPGPEPREALASVTYLGRPRGEEVRLSGEHLEYRWVTIGEWLALPSWWSPGDIRRVPGLLRALPEEPPPEPPLPEAAGEGPVLANLGAGTVLVDLRGAEPRALLLRRRKPPAGLWENPGGLLEPGEDFLAAARRETLEETGLAAEPGRPWWARIEPWKGPGDPELYAGVGFLAVHPGGEVHLEQTAHDAYLWATREEWRSSPSWYTRGELDALWRAVDALRRAGHGP
ncbi:MAG: NUDIX hydrolase [Rubrobacter sp.]|nr:NUDIX hydrolase [Rubrobacter sp.]